MLYMYMSIFKAAYTHECDFKSLKIKKSDWYRSLKHTKKKSIELKKLAIDRICLVLSDRPLSIPLKLNTLFCGSDYFCLQQIL